jgi:DDE superfamily endonuclease
MLRYVELKEKPKDFLAVTGLRLEEFECLLATFEKCYQVLNKPKPKDTKKKKRRAAGGGRKGNLPTLGDKLLFILSYQKTAQLQTMQGLQFGLSQPQANYWIHRLLVVLQKSLAEMGMKPEREGKKVADLIQAREGGANLSLDATERELQRPVNGDKQKQKYSGKKKTHTDKNLLLVNENTKKVVYLSPTVEGKKHDKKLADESKISYPENASLTKDTGFQGYEPKRVLSEQPKKSKRKGVDGD